VFTCSAPVGPVDLSGTEVAPTYSACLRITQNVAARVLWVADSGASHPRYTWSSGAHSVLTDFKSSMYCHQRGLWDSEAHDGGASEWLASCVMQQAVEHVCALSVALHVLESSVIGVCDAVAWTHRDSLTRCTRAVTTGTGLCHALCNKLLSKADLHAADTDLVSLLEALTSEPRGFNSGYNKTQTGKTGTMWFALLSAPLACSHLL
jgi:hypothetical protein